ncbi:MAG: LptF/LptG family permease [Bacteroidales bacterium]|nr:LptF/LptG family permease [Bacteroidales bacterium]MBN2750654.1 LptF/LptG family permease [Bacteroidales bacterium]
MTKLGLKIIDLYIIRKFIGTYFYAILLIVGIAVIFDVTEKIDDFMEKGAPLKAIVFDYYMNFIPYFANLFSSLFTFIAVIFFTSKMAYNTEIISILSAGVSFRRMMFPYFISAFIIALFSFVLNSFIIPPANRVRLDFENTYIKKPYTNTERHIHKQVRPGVFIYMEAFNSYSNIGYKFSMEKFEDGVLKSKLMSDYVRWDSTKNTWTVNSYYIRTYLENGEQLISGARLDTNIYVVPTDFTQRLNVVETMNIFELNKFIAQQRLQGADTVEVFLIEKYGRFAYPFSTFILTLIGVALSSRKVRGGIGLHIGLGLAISFSYILFMRFSTMFAVSGSMDPLLAVWIPNLLFAIIALALYKLAPK